MVEGLVDSSGQCSFESVLGSGQPRQKEVTGGIPSLETSILAVSRYELTQSASSSIASIIEMSMQSVTSESWYGVLV